MVDKKWLAKTGIVLEVWETEHGTIAGTDTLEDVVTGKGTLLYTFPGKTVTYHVVTNDENIGRATALAFATLHYTGKLRRISFDLRSVSHAR